MSSQMLKAKIRSLGELPESDNLPVLRRQLARLEQGEPEPVDPAADTAVGDTVAEGHEDVERNNKDD